MSAEQENSEATATNTNKKRWPIRRLILFVFVLLILLFFPFAHETWFRCAICSTSHSELRILGILASSSEKEGECSKWYRANVEPHHDHVWVRSPMAYGYSLCGLPIYMSQSTLLVNGPIVWLSSDRLKIKMYEASPDPVLTRDLFLQLARYKPFDTEEYKHQMELINRLKHWSESGCQDPWPFETQ